MNPDSHIKTTIPKDLRIKIVLLAAVVALFIVQLYPSIVVRHQKYSLGEIAKRDIKAPQDFFVQDKQATEERRSKAVDNILTVYDHDPHILSQLMENVRAAFTDMQQTIAQLDNRLNAASAVDEETTESSDTRKHERLKILLSQKNHFEEQLGLKISQGAYRLLIQEEFSPNIAALINKILSKILTNGVVGNKEILLKETERGITLRNVANQTEIPISAIRQYYSPDQAKTIVRIVAQPLVKDLNYNVINLIVDVCQQLVQPNITLNRNETENRKNQALKNIKPVMYQIKAGEMLLREGERVTHLKLLRLQALADQKKTQHLTSTALGAAVILAVLLTLTYLIYFGHQQHHHLNTVKNLVFMALILTAVLFMVKLSGGFSRAVTANAAFSIPSSAIIYATPMSAGAMLVCIFLGFEITVLFALAAAVCTALLTGNRIEIFIYFMLNSAMAAYWVQQCRERKLFITAGLKLGILNMLLVTALCIYTSDYTDVSLPWNWAMAFLGGIGSGIVTVGMAPLMEMTFRYTTDITLLELANLDQPILRRLMFEAPGTYHHSAIVGSLVEAAATAIGANPLLAKVCGYYHDIGKVDKPLYFIENQRVGKNKHDKLAPSMSSLILIAHVKNGVEIAKKNKLGQSIIDTIQQHHGTSLISVFFEKAKQIKGADAVNINDFRYPGPKPQTKETGLVMLADVVEAASRTLDDPTPARIQGLVQNLINKVFFDGQLDNCELTLKDLHNIAKSFNKILNGIHHHRIEYVESTTREKRKRRNDSADRQPADPSSRRDENRSDESPSHIKRLGLS